VHIFRAYCFSGC